MDTRLTSAAKEVIIGEGRPTVLIGERINPSGKKKMAEALRAGNLDIICQEAKAQVNAGADMIDVNVNTIGVDELSMLPRAVQAVMGVVDVPLCIDSPNPDSIEAALKVYKGKALINSVTGEAGSMARLLPMAKKYNAAVIGMPSDENGIPLNADGRVAVAKKIVDRAEKEGIPKEDVIIDCLALAVGADSGAGQVTLETARRVKAELGVNLTLGLSNISFGLPNREFINSAMLAITIAAGFTCLIVDVAKVRQVALAADVLTGHDKFAMRYLKAYREMMKVQQQAESAKQ